ncbi:MAG TPA: hypothetical protein VJO52_03670 [Gemmatimonadaceae bacterium]|nr:hypothetical protein [Gemmatimonadaceae bacterium]
MSFHGWMLSKEFHRLRRRRALRARGASRGVLVSDREPAVQHQVVRRPPCRGRYSRRPPTERPSTSSARRWLASARLTRFPFWGSELHVTLHDAPAHTTIGINVVALAFIVLLCSARPAGAFATRA